LPDPIDLPCRQHSRQGVAVRRDPLHFAGIDTRCHGIGRKKLGHRAECGIRQRLALEVSRFRNARLLEHINRVRRLGIDNGNELDRNVVVRAAKNDRECIGKSQLRGCVRHLLDGVSRALRAHDLDLEIFARVIALLHGHEIVAVPAIQAVIGNEDDLVGGVRNAGQHQRSSEHRKQRKPGGLCKTLRASHFASRANRTMRGRGLARAT